MRRRRKNPEPTAIPEMMLGFSPPRVDSSSLSSLSSSPSPSSEASGFGDPVVFDSLAYTTSMPVGGVSSGSVFSRSRGRRMDGDLC